MFCNINHQKLAVTLLAVKSFVLLFCFCWTFSLLAQRERNYIYVLDCSNSMEATYHIWEPTLQYLHEDIDRLSPTTMVTIVPFQGKVYDDLLRHEQKKDFDWKSFEFLALLSIVGFWCLTSRVLVYYLFPVVPLFAAWFALTSRRETQARLAVPCAGISVVVLVGALVGGMFFSDKMLGEKTKFSPCANHYAYEFYHGRMPDDELIRYRHAYEQWVKACEAREAAEEASRKAAGK